MNSLRIRKQNSGDERRMECESRDILDFMNLEGLSIVSCKKGDSCFGMNGATGAGGLFAKFFFFPAKKQDRKERNRNE